MSLVLEEELGMEVSSRRCCAHYERGQRSCVMLLIDCLSLFLSHYPHTQSSEIVSSKMVYFRLAARRCKIILAADICENLPISWHISSVVIVLRPFVREGWVFEMF